MGTLNQEASKPLSDFRHRTSLCRSGCYKQKQTLDSGCFESLVSNLRSTLCMYSTCTVAYILPVPLIDLDYLQGAIKSYDLILQLLSLPPLPPLFTILTILHKIISSNLGKVAVCNHACMHLLSYMVQHKGFAKLPTSSLDVAPLQPF